MPLIESWPKYQRTMDPNLTEALIIIFVFIEKKIYIESNPDNDVKRGTILIIIIHDCNTYYLYVTAT